MTTAHTSPTGATQRPLRRATMRRSASVVAAAATFAAVAAGCGSPGEQSVDNVSIPPPVRTTTTTEPERTTTTARVDATTTTAAPTTTLAPTTTFEPAASGPPSSVATAYVPGGGRRPRTPCEPGPDLGQLVLGENCRHLLVDGMVREYVVYVPATVDRAVPAPLVVFLHGNDQNGDDSLRDTGWKRRAEEREVVVVFPTSLEYELLGDEDGGWTFRWNGYPLPEQIARARRVEGYPAAAPMPADDASFVERVIADVQYQWPIDPAKVFVAGFQSGAELATRLVVENPAVFAGLALVGGGVGVPTVELPAPPRSVPTLMILGKDDLEYGDELTTPSQSPEIPLESDAFIASAVGQFVMTRLGTLTGTDPAAAQAVSEQHLTSYTSGGPGLGGGPGALSLKVVNGLSGDYPLGQNNTAELIGTVEISNFFGLDGRAD